MPATPPRRTAPALAVAFAAAASLAAARPARAQAAAQADVRRADVVRTAARPVATYHLAAGRDAGLPARVTVSDSAGALVASYQPAAGGAARALAVAVLDTDLVLQGETPTGLLTLVLDGQAVAPAGRVTGRWALGDRGGPLRGRVKD